MSHRRYLVLLAAALLLPVLVSAQEEAFYEVQGVEYYYATGLHGTGHMTMGYDPSGETAQAFDGCSWAKLRPDINRGRIQVMGHYGHLPMVIDFGRFTNETVSPDSIGAGLTTDVGPGAGQPVATEIAAAGEAVVSIGGLDLIDPITGDTTFQGTWFVTDKDLRDDTTGALVTDAPADGHEMHMHVATDPSLPEQGPFSWSASEPRGGPSPYLPPEEVYEMLYVVPNLRLTGTATLDFDATTLAPAGENHLVVSVYTSNGALVDSFEAAPDVTQPASQQIQFSLDDYGDYYITVRGSVSLLQYDLSMQQDPPETFAMDFWWDTVAPGYAGLEARYACDDDVFGETLAAYIAPPADPVSFDWKISIFTVAAGITTLLVGVALVLSARSRSALHQAARDE